MALLDFQTDLSVGQDGNTDAASVDPFRNILDSISGGAIQPKPLVDGGSATDVLNRVKAGPPLPGGIPFALMSPTQTLRGIPVETSPPAPNEVTTVADELNFTHEFGMEVHEYLAWWYEADLYRTLGNASLNSTTRLNALMFLANDMKAKYEAHRVATAAHPVADGANVITALAATDLASTQALLDDIKAMFNLHRTQATVHAANDTINVVTAANSAGTDLATAVALAADITAMYFAHGLNQLANGFHTIPDTINQFEKGGQALFQAILDAAGIDLIQFPLVIRAAESGGWFPEAMTLKKMRDGKYSNGTQIKYRAFGTHADAMRLAFPAIETVETGAGFTDLGAIFADVFNSGEFNEPWGDASPTNPALGLFPNWPNLGGSIVDALGGKAHFYMGSYHTPFRHRCLLVNKTWFNGEGPDAPANDAERNMIRAAVRYCAMRNVAQSQVGGDAIVNRWQDADPQNSPVVIHRAMPRDILDRMRTALSDAQENIASGVLSGGYPDERYAIMLDSQRTFMKENAVRWGALPDRTYRVARTDYETDLKPDRP